MECPVYHAGVQLYLSVLAVWVCIPISPTPFPDWVVFLMLLFWRCEVPCGFSEPLGSETSLLVSCMQGCSALSRHPYLRACGLYTMKQSVTFRLHFFGMNCQGHYCICDDKRHKPILASCIAVEAHEKLCSTLGQGSWLLPVQTSLFSRQPG